MLSFSFPFCPLFYLNALTWNMCEQALTSLPKVNKRKGKWNKEARRPTVSVCSTAAKGGFFSLTLCTQTVQSMTLYPKLLPWKKSYGTKLPAWRKMLTEAKDLLGFALMMDCPGDYELWLKLTSGKLLSMEAIFMDIWNSLLCNLYPFCDRASYGQTPTSGIRGWFLWLETLRLKISSLWAGLFSKPLEVFYGWVC